MGSNLSLLKQVGFEIIMSTRCIINVDDLVPHHVVHIMYDNIDGEVLTRATVKGWEHPGDYYQNTIEFDFNDWGGCRKWLEPWLIRHAVPFSLA